LFGPEDHPDMELFEWNLPLVIKISIGRHKVAKALIDRGGFVKSLDEKNLHSDGP
jgi:hypothetical protein